MHVAIVLFGLNSPTTFNTSLREAKLRKPGFRELQTYRRKTEFNAKSVLLSFLGLGLDGQVLGFGRHVVSLACGTGARAPLDLTQVNC